MTKILAIRTKTRYAIAITLMLAFCISTIALPSTNAHTPAWTIDTYAKIAVAPNPIGVGQPTYISMWVDSPLPDAYPHNTIRRSGYTLTITAPDNKTTTTQKWDIIQDTTGIQFYTFTPTQVGTYTLKFDYAGQKYTWNKANTPDISANAANYENDTYLASSRTITVTVQQDPLPAPINSYPLPTEYWARPIEAQNSDWWSISSNWLGQPYIDERVQPYGTAPNTPHIMWSKPLDAGGVVGGMYGDTQGEGFYMGGSYDPRFAISTSSSGLILNGMLYYALPLGNSGTGGGYTAVDLRTGKEIWHNDNMGYTGSGVGIPAFGYLQSVDSANQHGVIPTGILFTNNFAQGFDAMTGKWIYNVTGVPSGPTTAAPTGEVLRYVYTASSNSIAQWNSSRMWAWGWSSEGGKTPAYGITLNGTLDYQTKQSCYDWNVTLPNLGPGAWSIANLGSQTCANPAVSLDNVLLMVQSNASMANVTAISLKPESRGSIMWQKTINSDGTYVTEALQTWDPEAGVFVTYNRETLQYYGFSLTDGSKLWGPITNPSTDFEWFSSGGGGGGLAISIYGNMYQSGWGGVTTCWDIKTGELKWNYGNGGPENSTMDFQQPWGYRPIWIGAAADGKLYLMSNEHSPNTPLYKDALLRCINATDGTEIWTIMGWGSGQYGPSQNGVIVADGYLAFANMYDMKVYVIGKGPSAMTVEAPATATKLGDSIVIRGTVTDIATGTKQDEQAARFPNGVPTVSDESQSAWMEYVYMQKPHPTDATGVLVTINVADANGNYREIGSTITSDGFFTINWKPDIEGQYTVYASFAGSESYWPSHAMTSFAVDPAAPTPAPTQPPITSATDTYLLPGIAAIIVVIAVGFAVTILVLRKRP